ncbi:MAG: ABC transporter permease [Armatimonadota bacterium]
MSASEAATVARAPVTGVDSPWVRARRRFGRNRLAVVSLIALAVIHLASAAGPAVIPQSPFEVDPLRTLRPPGPGHPLGTDESGRDVLARLLYGGRVSLAVGIVSVLLSVTLGTIVGAIAGYFGSATDSVLMRLTDGFMALPTFFLLLVILAVFGGSLWSVIVVIGITSWMNLGRLVRGEFLRWKAQDFVEAARALGVRDAAIMWRHLLPHTLPSIIVTATLGVAFAILTESAVSYLGMGIQLPIPSWGNMLSNAQNYIYSQPLLAVYPGVMILITVLAYNFLGNGLRDALDPRRGA